MKIRIFTVLPLQTPEWKPDRPPVVVVYRP